MQRYVGIATPSLRDPRDRRSLLGTLVPIMGRLLLPRAYRVLLAITRADIATFLLDRLDDTRFIRAAPAINN